MNTKPRPETHVFTTARLACAKSRACQVGVDRDPVLARVICGREIGVK